MSIGGGGRGDGELQEVSEQLQAIEAQIEGLQAQIEALQAERADISEAIDAIDRLETGSTVQVPIGGGARVRATIEDIDEVIVSLGGDYSVEQDQGDASELLEAQSERLEERIEELNQELAELETEEQELNQRAQQLQQQQLQQQMQGQGGLGGGGDDE